MAFRIELEESPEDALRRIVREQCGDLRADLDRITVAPEAAVHDVRTRCKRLRGLVRLFREALGPSVYRKADGALRDGAKCLAGARDATAMVECLDAMSGRHRAKLRGELPGVDVPAAIRAAFEAERARIEGRPAGAPRLRAVRAAVDAFEAEVLDARLHLRGDAAWVGGFERTYRRARKGLRHCAPASSAERFHDWRKRVKYHRFHVKVLARAWSRWYRARSRALGELAELLGHEHDIAVLLEHVDRLRLPCGSADSDAFGEAVARRQARVRDRALALGAILFAGKPRRFTRDVLGTRRLGRSALELPDFVHR